MDEKQVFIDSVRSSAKKELTAEEVNFLGATFDAFRAMPKGIDETKAKSIIAESLGDFGDDKTMATRHSETMQQIESLRAGNTPKEKGGFWAAMREAIEEKKEDILAGRSVKVTVRTASTITMSNIVAPKSLGLHDTEVDAAQTLPEFLPSSLITEKNLGEGSNPWVWMERAVKEGAPDYVLEGNEKPPMDYSWTEAEVTAKLIAAYVPISKIATWNYPSLENEVRSDLVDQLLNKYNDAIINGTGTAQINGLLGYYAVELDLAAFTAGTRSKITAGNFWDVLLLAWAQSRKAVRGQRPDAVLVSIDLIGELDLQKNGDGTYLFPNWLMKQDKSLKGARIIETEYLADRTILIGSFSKAEFNFVKAPEITIGWINDQFIHNQYCILCEFFGMQRVKAHKNNFVKVTDIDAAVTVISPALVA